MISSRVVRRCSIEATGWARTVRTVDSDDGVTMVALVSTHFVTRDNLSLERLRGVVGVGVSGANRDCRELLTTEVPSTRGAVPAGMYCALHLLLLSWAHKALSMPLWVNGALEASGGPGNCIVRSRMACIESCTLLRLVTDLTLELSVSDMGEKAAGRGKARAGCGDVVQLTSAVLWYICAFAVVCDSFRASTISYALCDDIGVESRDSRKSKGSGLLSFWNWGTGGANLSSYWKVANGVVLLELVPFHSLCEGVFAALSIMNPGFAIDDNRMCSLGAPSP